MRKNAVSLLKALVAPFVEYISPKPENSFSSDRNSYKSGVTVSKSEILCLLIFIAALAFIAVISPVLCLTSLFIDLNLEGLWYFWLITFAETVYSAWLIGRKIGRKKRVLNVTATKPCQFSFLGLYYDCPINWTHHDAYFE